MVRRARVVAELLNVRAGDGEEAVEELLFVHAWIQRRAAAQCHLFGQRDHLIQRVFAGEAPDEGLDGAAQIVVAFAGAESGEHFKHHGQHDAGPSGTDERDGAVEIEDGNTGEGRRCAGVDGFNHGSSIVARR